MSPTDLPSWSASTISTSEGGTSCVIVPEAASTPVAYRMLYLYRIITGSEMSAIAITCAATVPVMAPRMKPTMITE